MEENVLAVLTTAAGPIVNGVNLGIQSQLGKQEVSNRACHTSVIVPPYVGMLVSQQRSDRLQFIEYETEDLASLVLHNLLQIDVVGGHNGNAPEHIHCVIVEQRTYGPHLS